MRSLPKFTIGLALVGLFLAGPAYAQFSPIAVPPIKKRVLVLHAEVIELALSEGDDELAGEMDAERLLWEAGPVPEPYRVVASLKQNTVRDFVSRIERPEAPDLLLTYLSRDGRRVRFRLEEEGAPRKDGQTLMIRLSRSRGPAQGLSVTPLAAPGSWLRLKLERR